jgi:hypothetical protein
MTTAILRLLIDFGLMILVQLVQWIIYPSLARMQRETLSKWHHIYAQRITIWVLPLMFGQAAIIAYQSVDQFSWLHIISLSLVVYCFLVTFLKAVPLHAQINEQSQDEETFQDLLKWNLHRTLCWTLVFLLGLISYLT